MSTDNKDFISIRYEANTRKQLEDSLNKAEKDFDRLVAEGYAAVDIVISDHLASEGVWVEAAEVHKKLVHTDYLYKTNNEKWATDNGYDIKLYIHNNNIKIEPIAKENQDFIYQNTQ